MHRLPVQNNLFCIILLYANQSFHKLLVYEHLTGAFLHWLTVGFHALRTISICLDVKVVAVQQFEDFLWNPHYGTFEQANDGKCSVESSRFCCSSHCIIRRMSRCRLCFHTNRSTPSNLWRTAHPICTLWPAVDSPAWYPFRLTQHLSIWWCRLVDELHEYLQCWWVQTKIVTAIGCKYWDAERNISKMSTHHLVRRKHVSYWRIETVSWSTSHVLTS